ncbi:hypothetical protein T439DRAFT_357433 [Meredithblackwellia eburnea MCA 4105]
MRSRRNSATPTIQKEDSASSQSSDSDDSEYAPSQAAAKRIRRQRSGSTTTNNSHTLKDSKGRFRKAEPDEISRPQVVIQPDPTTQDSEPEEEPERPSITSSRRWTANCLRRCRRRPLLARPLSESTDYKLWQEKLGLEAPLLGWTKPLERPYAPWLSKVFGPPSPPPRSPVAEHEPEVEEEAATSNHHSSGPSRAMEADVESHREAEGSVEPVRNKKRRRSWEPFALTGDGEQVLRRSARSLANTKSYANPVQRRRSSRAARSVDENSHPSKNFTGSGLRSEGGNPADTDTGLEGPRPVLKGKVNDQEEDAAVGLLSLSTLLRGVVMKNQEQRHVGDPEGKRGMGPRTGRRPSSSANPTLTAALPGSFLLPSPSNEGLHTPSPFSHALSRLPQARTISGPFTSRLSPIASSRSVSPAKSDLVQSEPKPPSSFLTEILPPEHIQNDFIGSVLPSAPIATSCPSEHPGAPPCPTPSYADSISDERHGSTPPRPVPRASPLGLASALEIELKEAKANTSSALDFKPRKAIKRAPRVAKPLIGVFPGTTSGKQEELPSVGEDSKYYEPLEIDFKTQRRSVRAVRDLLFRGGEVPIDPVYDPRRVVRNLALLNHISKIHLLHIIPNYAFLGLLRRKPRCDLLPQPFLHVQHNAMSANVPPLGFDSMISKAAQYAYGRRLGVEEIQWLKSRHEGLYKYLETLAAVRRVNEIVKQEEERDPQLCELMKDKVKEERRGNDGGGDGTVLRDVMKMQKRWNAGGENATETLGKHGGARKRRRKGQFKNW